MADRLPALLPRLAAITLLALLATATLTYAAGRKLAAAPATPAAAVQPAATVVVPDVRDQAFVFAKGTLEDGGFAWRVTGSVHGYAANTVVAQSPPAGTKLIDTGAPLVTLTLKRNARYPQKGEAQDASPYAATAVKPAELASAPVGPAAPATATTAAPATTAPAATTPATTTPATTTPAATTTTPAATAAAPKAAQWPQSRPPAFVVPGAKKEPLNEMPLPDRAKALGAWLDAHPKKTPANAKYWLYQNEWVVTGAQLGWWRGAEALQTLIAVDRHAQTLWGIGAKSADAAAGALREVQARSK